jgi:chemotaxis protein CheD
MGVAESVGVAGSRREQRVVGIAEMLVSGRADHVLVTHSLGSCLGVALFDPETGWGGLVHCMLPLSRANPERAAAEPCIFTDTGVAALLGAMFEAGCRRERIVAKVAGAASQLDEEGFFRIGERNYAVLRRILWKNRILIAAEDVGGRDTRTLLLEIGSGRTLVKKDGIAREL